MGQNLRGQPANVVYCVGEMTMESLREGRREEGREEGREGVREEGKV